jgi:predicted transcriptional regulator of viral defense system
MSKKRREKYIPKRLPSFNTARVYSLIVANPMITIKEMCEHLGLKRDHLTMLVHRLRQRGCLARNYKPFVVLSPYKLYGLEFNVL